MNETDSKIEAYQAMKLGYLPVIAVSIRHTEPNSAKARQSLTIEMLKGSAEVVQLEFSELRQLRLADLGPGSHCFLNIRSLVSDQLEGIRYSVSNIEQDLTLSFYCANFHVLAKRSE